MMFPQNCARAAPQTALAARRARRLAGRRPAVTAAARPRGLNLRWVPGAVRRSAAPPILLQGWDRGGHSRSAVSIGSWAHVDRGRRLVGPNWMRSAARLVCADVLGMVIPVPDDTAHEWRTPLTVIQGYVEALQNEDAP